MYIVWLSFNGKLFLSSNLKEYGPRHIHVLFFNQKFDSGVNEVLS